ncbi:hypothetical protein Hanom_Chr16g01423411 [Helianthus anomalus]
MWCDASFVLLLSVPKRDHSLYFLHYNKTLVGSSITNNHFQISKTFNSCYLSLIYISTDRRGRRWK